MSHREPPPRATCADCALFVDDPLELERAFPGVLALSSTYGSTRGRSGICLPRDTFQDPVPACNEFRPRPQGDAESDAG